ncbi:hypothetical protein KKG24_04975, partial [Patescibacteria group bacterium]|nr:hypothetical protein [Patescibacteria group bacterium]
NWLIISLVLLNFGLSNWVVVALLIYLLLKSLIFIKDILSIMDLIALVFVGIGFFAGFNHLLLLSGVYLISKGFYSLV